MTPTTCCSNKFARAQKVPSAWCQRAAPAVFQFSPTLAQGESNPNVVRLYLLNTNKDAISHSEASLEDLDLPVEPLPLRPPSTSLQKQHEANGDIPPPLQVANGEPEGLDPLSGEDLEPGCFDLVMPDTHEQNEVTPKARGKHKLEVRSELLFSNLHLQAIFADPLHLHRFSNYLYRHRPASIPLLTYYLDALKALRAIDYGNAVLHNLSQLTDFNFTHEPIQAPPVENNVLREKAETAFDILVQEDLPMYITHNWIQTVSMSIRQRIMGNPHHESEGLAEVFCITDPSRPDNPIVFMSEQFNRTTQYGVDYIIGRNCRFLQGPCTNPFSVTRIREKLASGVEHYETFLNYRRDGSPFMNLVMVSTQESSNLILFCTRAEYYDSLHLSTIIVVRFATLLALRSTYLAWQ